jgi:hypothetical protein
VNGLSVPSFVDFSSPKIDALRRAIGTAGSDSTGVSSVGESLRRSE